MRPRYRLSLFAEIDDVLNAIADDLTALLAPYQPNIPPSFPNNAPTAGQIVATMVAPGQPIVLPVTTRLENFEAQVGIYAAVSGSKVEGEIRTDDPVSSTSSTVTYETARESRQVFVEIWAPDRPKVAAIALLLRQHLGDVYTLPQPDGTVTKLCFQGDRDDDTEQAHSVYIRQLIFWADYTTVTTFPGAPAATLTATPTVVASISPYSPLASQL